MAFTSALPQPQIQPPCIQETKSPKSMERGDNQVKEVLNRQITKVLNKGDVFVFPVGLIHYQRNASYTPATAIAALSSQNPGVITIANVVFGATPAIATDILSKAFQLDNNVVNSLQFKF